MRMSQRFCAIILSFMMVFSMCLVGIDRNQSAYADPITSTAIPGKIEAEAYSDMAGIQTDATDDSGGGQYIGWTDAGDWMDYQVNVQAAGVYEVGLRLASPLLGTSQIQLKNASGTVLALVNVPNTGGWGSFQTIHANLDLPAGEQILRVYVLNSGFNFNWMEFSFVSSPTPTPEPTATPTPTATPLPVNRASVPGKVEVENYNAMNGVQKSTTLDTGGGMIVTSLDTGDWLDFTYTEVQAAGTYDLAIRVASQGSGKQLQLQNSRGVALATVNVPDTGGMDSWQTIHVALELPAGSQSLRLVSSNSGINLNWLNFTLSAAVTVDLTIPSNAINITDCGATANDATDDTTAIVSCIANAKAAGITVFVPAGTFIYNDCLTLDGVDMIGTGAESILKSINLALQCILIKGVGSDISKVKLTTINPIQRLSTDVSARIYVSPEAVNFSIRNVIIEGASSAGIISFGSNGVISGNTVSRTLADGIHITGLSNHVTIENNVCRDNGDDQIAVVSYEKFGSWVRDVTIMHNDVAGGHARGITVSGGEDVTISNNKIALVGGAGIFIASEGSYQTYSVLDLEVSDNTIIHDSLNGSVPEKGGIRLQATYKNPSIDHALIRNNSIYGSTDSGILIVGTAVINAEFQNNAIVNPLAYGISLVRTVVGNFTFEDNTVKGSGKAPFSNLAAGANVISDMPNVSPDDGGGVGEYLAVK